MLRNSRIVSRINKQKFKAIQQLFYENSNMSQKVNNTRIKLSESKRIKKANLNKTVTFGKDFGPASNQLKMTLDPENHALEKKVKKCKKRVKRSKKSESVNKTVQTVVAYPDQINTEDRTLQSLYSKSLLKLLEQPSPVQTPKLRVTSKPKHFQFPKREVTPLRPSRSHNSPSNALKSTSTHRIGSYRHHKSGANHSFCWSRHQVRTNTQYTSLRCRAGYRE